MISNTQCPDSLAQVESGGAVKYLSGWYAIAPSARVKKKPVVIERFGLSLVLWRNNNGTLVALQDSCPHRGAKLSLGKLTGDTIRCPYHGFEFGTEGQCTFAPELGKAIPKLTAAHFSTQEAMGMIWLYYGETAQGELPSPLLELDKQFQQRYAQTDKKWHSHISYCIENQLDYTHLPDVHHNTIGRRFNMPKQPKFELDKARISIYLDKPTPAIDFYFPSTWVLNISEKMKLIIFFAPINPKQTHLYLRTYNRVLSVPLLGKLLSPLFNLVNKIILRQDQRIVHSQGQGMSYEAVGDRLMTHDKAIKYFRQQWQK
jgi:phenylpropionate dioxygenase-like ring-hydroxylating dioxygenase large terminal subunit